jgi:hypothetical protein
MTIANCKRSKVSSDCRLESFSLTGWTRSWFRVTFAKKSTARCARPQSAFDASDEIGSGVSKCP